MALVVVDASVLIAFLNAADSLHTRATAALAAHRRDELVLPASAYAEVLVGAYRSGAGAVATFQHSIQALPVRVEPISADIADRAAQLRSQRGSLRLPDALVLATADVLNAAIVLTGDATWPRISARAQLI